MFRWRCVERLTIGVEFELTIETVVDRICRCNSEDQWYPMTVRLIAGCVVLLFGAAVMIFVAGLEETNISLLKPDDPQIVATGRQIYAAECASCHGLDRKGQEGWPGRSSDGVPLAPPHDGSGHTWQHPDHALIELTKYGTSEVACRTLDKDAMPEFQETLSDEQVIAVLSFIKAQWTPEIQSQHDEVNAVFGQSDH